ncbi:MAG: hypothetical protein L0Y66_19960, partial [Myxococcaceae bacterium]|nr:hypothetical protein [Myxococcaceae bacterium]
MTRPLALLLCLACATASAEEPDRGPVRTAVVLLPEGEAPVEGGCWLRADVCVQTGRELAQLRADNARLTALAW